VLPGGGGEMATAMRRRKKRMCFIYYYYTFQIKLGFNVRDLPIVLHKLTVKYGCALDDEE
jgi:hypothetical protein